MMMIYEAECEIHGNQIVYRIVKAEHEVEAMQAVESMLRDEILPIDDEPPCILNLVCLGEATD